MAESGFREAPATADSEESAALADESVSCLLSDLVLLSVSSKDGFGGGLGGADTPESLDLLVAVFSESVAFELDLGSSFGALAVLFELSSSLELCFLVLAALLSLGLGPFSDFLLSASVSASSTLNDGAGGATGGAAMEAEPGVDPDSFFSCLALVACFSLALLDPEGPVESPSSFTSKLGLGGALGGAVMPAFEAPASRSEEPSSFFVLEVLSWDYPEVALAESVFACGCCSALSCSVLAELLASVASP